ncbi:MAG: hypothetical protein JRH20_01960, partial [Deltaproteobacteria bacterium]|nr:hypothetical protein [Deltaproteobacteria bacterium]
ECKDSSAYCVVTNSMETFCGQACGVDADCPANYRCLQIADKANNQCIPADFSCYY